MTTLSRKAAFDWFDLPSPRIDDSVSGHRPIGEPTIVDPIGQPDRFMAFRYAFAFPNSTRADLMIANWSVENLRRSALRVPPAQPVPAATLSALADVIALPGQLEELKERVRILEARLASLEANPTEQLLNAQGAGELLSMTPAAVLQAYRRGDLPGIKMGRRVRFRRSDLVKV